MNPPTRIIFCAPNHIRNEMFNAMTQLEMDVFYLCLRHAIDMGYDRLVVPESGQLEHGAAFDFAIRTTTDRDGTIRVDIANACVLNPIGAWRAL